MKINKILVGGLFDRFDHDLVFRPDERITIMIGPNGFGKTMIPRMINALFNQSVRTLARMPFHKLQVDFDSGSSLVALHMQQTSLKLQFSEQGKSSQTFIPEPRISPKELGFLTEVIEEIIPILDQVGPSLWRHRRTGETLELEDVIERFRDELPRIEVELGSKMPQWLQRIRKAIPVRFIDTERLTHPLTERSRVPNTHRPLPQVATERTVRRYSGELGQRIQKTLTEYGSLSQALDRTFPVRLVEEPPRSDLTMDSLRGELAEVEAKRQRLMEAGLLAQDQKGLGIPALENVDESRRGVLAVYARDAKQKLGVFDDVLAKVDMLRRIVNSRFLHKRVTIGPEGFRVITSDGTPLELEMLSSGEQHELVILYDLLFRVSENSFILIDEPELSLHVAWQEQFLDDLEEIAELSNFRVLLATHSPQIIGDRWDLTAELKGPS